MLEVLGRVLGWVGWFGRVVGLGWVVGVLDRVMGGSLGGIILDGIVGSSDPEVIVDQVGNLSASKETVLFLGLLFLQTDFPFEMGVMDDFVQR